jgi:hypothetical protein
VRLLIQKDRHRAKRTRVRHLDALPFVSALVGGEAPQVSDLLSGLQTKAYPDALRDLTSLVEEDVIAVVEPPHLRTAPDPGGESVTRDKAAGNSQATERKLAANH